MGIARSSCPRRSLSTSGATPLWMALHCPLIWSRSRGGPPATVPDAPSLCGSEKAAPPDVSAASVAPAADVTPEEGPSIRRAVPTDLPRLVELLMSGALPGAPDTEDPTEADRYRVALDEIQGAGGEVLVAERSGEVIGFCQLVFFRHLQ